MSYTEIRLTIDASYFKIQILCSDSLMCYNQNNHFLIYGESKFESLFSLELCASYKLFQRQCEMSTNLTWQYSSFSVLNQ